MNASGDIFLHEREPNWSRGWLRARSIEVLTGQLKSSKMSVGSRDDVSARVGEELHLLSFDSVIEGHEAPNNLRQSTRHSFCLHPLVGLLFVSEQVFHQLPLVSHFPGLLVRDRVAAARQSLC